MLTGTRSPLLSLAVLGLAVLAAPASAQEASSGFDLRATLTGGVQYSDNHGAATGYRAVLYPVWKFDDHWSVSGAYQLNSAHLYPDNYPPAPYLAKGYLLQASLNYSLVGRNKSLVVRVGQLSSAFGSFLLHYDDADNPLMNPPPQYGYYYATVTTLGFAAAQADATLGKWDMRLQLANSSPANPRVVFSRDEYRNWAGGAGYTIRQGFRVGASAYYGPYLDHDDPYYFPGEAPPSALPARAVGVDAQWAGGHWNVQGEWQKFTFPYKVIPVFHEQAAYAEVKRALHPRWYVAARVSDVSPSAGYSRQRLEMAAGFRPAASSLLKVGYGVGSHNDNCFAMQLIVAVHAFSFAWR